MVEVKNKPWEEGVLDFHACASCPLTPTSALPPTLNYCASSRVTREKGTWIEELPRRDCMSVGHCPDCWKGPAHCAMPKQVAQHYMRRLAEHG